MREISDHPNFATIIALWEIV